MPVVDKDSRRSAPHSPEAQMLELRLLPILNAAAERLRKEFPAYKIHTYSGSVGSRTSLQGHHVGMGGTIPGITSRAEPDGLGLEVGIAHLTTEPLLSGLYVCWDHPSGHIELDLLPEPISLDDAAWAFAEESIPPLVDALRGALLRGKPPDDAVSLFPYTSPFVGSGVDCGTDGGPVSVGAGATVTTVVACSIR